MKIISFNVNNDYRNVKKNAQIIYDMILKHDPDVVGLQEVTPTMYDELRALNVSLQMSSKESQSYFNVMFSKYPDPIIKEPFKWSSMERSFLKQSISSLQTTHVTTHLESVACNANMRREQCKQICDNISGSVIIFGDTNFSNNEETIDNMLYLAPTNNKYFTWDSLYNKNASPPFRSNLDRFYVSPLNLSGCAYNVAILTNVDFSDHYPIMLTMAN